MFFEWLNRPLTTVKNNREEWHPRTIALPVGSLSLLSTLPLVAYTTLLKNRLTHHSYLG
jgi:hypothetical protein